MFVLNQYKFVVLMIVTRFYISRQGRLLSGTGNPVVLLDNGQLILNLHYNFTILSLNLMITKLKILIILGILKLDFLLMDHGRVLRFFSLELVMNSVMGLVLDQVIIY